jgi:hypothetical protein
MFDARIVEDDGRREPSLHEEIASLKVQLAECKKSYNDLIMSVSMKFPNESRHDTAKRYILDRENWISIAQKEEA